MKKHQDRHRMDSEFAAAATAGQGLTTPGLTTNGSSQNLNNSGMKQHMGIIAGSNIGSVTQSVIQNQMRTALDTVNHSVVPGKSSGASI